MFKKIRRTFRNLGQLNTTSDQVRNTLVPTIDRIYEELDALRSKLDGLEVMFENLEADRRTDAYQAVYKRKNPLVSVCIGTYNRSSLLIERCLASVRSQDYENLEIIVAGDCCTDNTEEAILDLGDNRIRFFNLPERGRYPASPERRWFVAGTASINHALAAARGDFITHLDDDDEYLPGRIRKLVDFIQREKADLVWHPFWAQDAKSRWFLNKAEQFKKTQVTTSSAFYHHWFKQIPWDISAHHYLEPGDWNRFRKIKYIEAVVKRFPEPLLRHYREHSQD